MSNKTLIDQIRHYQKDIERSPDNAERMIRCIKRLYVMPILVQHLQETGVGRSVNALRKYNGEVGEAAKALVAKWKAMVAAEESSDGEQVQEKPAEKAPEVIKSSKHGQSGRHHSDSDGAKKKEDRHRHRDVKKHSSSRSKHSRRHREEEEEEEDSEDSSSKRKRKKHSSSKHDKPKKMKVVKEESEPDSESSESDASDRVADNRSEVEEDEEEEVEEEAFSEEEVEKKPPQKEESSEAEESDHRHRSKHKHHKSSRSKSSHSSKEHHSSSHHSSSRRSHHSSSHHSSSSSSNKKSTDIKALIKENEKKIKKEKEEKEVAREEKEVIREEKRPSKSEKSEKPPKVKIEKNEDGSIDAGSGASFAEALMVGDFSSSSRKKKKVSSSSSPPKKKESKVGADNSPGSSSSVVSNIKVESSGKGSPSKINDLMKMPDLLSKKIKMESLNLDISATLPEISPHYKPLPHVHDLGPTRRLNKGVLEEEAMCSIMTTKYQRTKVFSGNKTGAFAVVPSLYSLCIQLLYENIDAVEFTGGVPYDILKPLLEKLNADQLYVLEHHNPYLIEDTDHLWQFHSKKDFRGEQRGEMESWRDLYLRCVDERERKLKALTANITKSMQKSVPVRQAKLAYVDSVVKPPRNVARKQAKYGTGSNQEKKQEILKKAAVGANNPAVMAKESVPAPPAPSRATQQILKKKKAPLMAKALQLIKGNRFKR